MIKKGLSLILCVSMIICSTLPNFANENDLVETTAESKIVEQLKIDLGEEKAEEIIGPSVDESEIDDFDIEPKEINHEDPEDEFEEEVTPTENEEEVEAEIISTESEEEQEAETTPAENEEEAEVETTSTESEEEQGAEVTSTESEEEAEAETTLAESESEVETETALAESESEVEAETTLAENESEVEAETTLTGNEEETTLTETEESAIENIEENNDNIIVATESNVQDFVDDELIEMVATISIIVEPYIATKSETLYGIDPPWMWWYLTDEGHTIHYTSIEPASGGVSSTSDYSINYTGLTKSDITRAVFDNQIVAKTCSGMFSRFKNLSTIDNLTYLNTSNVTSMSDMFYSCNNLTSVDLSSFNTLNVTNMGYMFYNCTSLLSLDLSNFNTSSVTDMYQMIFDCESLTTLNLSNFDTSNLTNMHSFFGQCYSLDSLNLSSFDTSNVTDMSGMFNDCRSLTNINLSSFDTSNVTDMSSMFSGCHSIENIDISNFNTGNVTNMNDMFGDCYLLTSIDLSGLNTTNVTYMNSMFGDCRNLRSINLSGLNNSNLTNTSRMFTGCYALSDINFTNFRTPMLTDMSYMFNNCSSLVNLNLSSFNTSNVTDMYMLFVDCYKLENVNLSSFNTENVTNMSEMFMDCYSLKNLDLSSFDTSSVTNFHSMFSACYSLTELDLSNFNTSNGLDFRWMFNNCESLTTLNLENFQTANGTNFKQMFSGMKNLTSLDISNFTISNTAITADFLCNTYSLNTIKISASVSNVINKVLFFGSWRSTLTNAEYTFNSNTGLVTIPTGTSGSYELISADKYMVYWYIENGNKLHFSKSIPTSSSFNAGQVIDELSINGRQNLPWVINNIEEAYIDDEIAPAYFNWFRNYRNLCTIDISNIDTSKLTNFSRSFHNCRRLTDINFGTIDTSNILYTDYMFYKCESLTSIDLSGFNTSNLIEASRMFYDCKQLNSFSFQNWNTNKLKRIDYMFYDCENLETIDFAGLTFNVTTAQSLFWKCKNLQSIDLTTFTNVNASTNMLYRCESLQSITCNNAFAKRLSNTGIRGDWQHPASGEIFYASTNTSITIPYNTTLEGEFTRYTSADRCNIYYNDDLYPSKIVNSGTTITPRLRLDCRPNCQYLGTYTNQGLTDEFDFNTPITTTTRIYEKFEGYGHRIVVYITNGGTQVETIYAHADVQFDAPTPPTKDNFTFVGWTDSYGGSEIYDFNSEPPYIDLVYNPCGIEYAITTLFAVWDDGSTPPIPPTPGPEPVTPTLESISISVAPTKVNYEVGEKFDPAGLKITRHYTDGNTTVLTYNDTTKNSFSFNPSLTTALTERDSYVTITYGGKSVRQNITVTVPKVVASISLISRPTKVNYTAGNYLRPAGLKIKVYYDDNTTEDITYSSLNADKFTFNPTLRTRLAVTDNQVAVTYKGKTATFNITVTRSGGGYVPSGGSGSRGGSSGSSATVGPMGDLTKNPAYAYLFENQTYTFNNLSATNLLSNNALAITLLSDPENANRANTNVTDINGNTGFGKWQKAPGTTIWYFLSGDIAANGTKGSVGFISNGWYNLGWNGNTGWYHFDAAGVMQVGWYEENGKRYYFNTNPQDANYGKSVTGTANINGTTYNFDANGALIS